MLEYGDRVKHIQTDRTGQIIGYMRNQCMYLVKFDKGSESWLSELDIERVKEDDTTGSH